MLNKCTTCNDTINTIDFKILLIVVIVGISLVEYFLGQKSRLFLFHHLEMYRLQIIFSDIVNCHFLLFQSGIVLNFLISVAYPFYMS